MAGSGQIEHPTEPNPGIAAQESNQSKQQRVSVGLGVYFDLEPQDPVYGREPNGKNADKT
jgi:hypothetical protein